MLAVRFHAAQDFRLEDIEEAEVGSTDVRVKVAVNGVCGTDVHFYYDPYTSGMPLSYDEVWHGRPEARRSRVLRNHRGRRGGGRPRQGRRPCRGVLHRLLR